MEEIELLKEDKPNEYEIKIQDRLLTDEKLLSRFKNFDKEKNKKKTY